VLDVYTFKQPRKNGNSNQKMEGGKQKSRGKRMKTKEKKELKSIHNVISFDWELPSREGADGA